MSASGKRTTARLLKEMLFIVIMAVALGAAVNLLHPRGFVLVSRSSLDVRRIVPISVEEARIKHAAGQAVFVDARDKAEFDSSRIQGAVSVPLIDAENHKGAAQDLSFLDRPVEAVIYCDGAACGAANALAKQMQERGYRRTIYIIDRGYPEWESRGYPVERGE
jgi:rhodanese-related sulfurtransferase